MDCDSNCPDEPRLSLACVAVTNTYENAEQWFWVNIKSSATALDLAITVRDQAPLWSSLQQENSNDIILLKPVHPLRASRRDIKNRLQILKLDPKPSTICLEPRTSLLEYFQGELSKDHIHVLIQLPPGFPIHSSISSKSNVSDERPAKRSRRDQGTYLSNRTTAIVMPSYLADKNVALDQWDAFHKILWKKGQDAFDAYAKPHKSVYYGTFKTMPNDSAFDLARITALLIREEWEMCWERAQEVDEQGTRRNFLIIGHPGIGRCLLLTLLRSC